jgi:hypothetical protein
MDTKQNTSKNLVQRVLAKAHFLGLFLAAAAAAAAQLTVVLDGTPRF